MYSGLGGQGSVAFALAEEFALQGAENSFTFFGIENLTEDYVRICKENNWRYNFVLKKKGSSLAYYKSVKGGILNLNPNVVLCHSTNLVLLLKWLRHTRGVKSIFVEHTDNRVKSIPEWVYSYLIVLFKMPAVLLKDDYFDGSRIFTWLLRWVKHYSVIPNGINTNFFAPESSFTNKQYTLGMAARFTNQKGQLELIKHVINWNKFNEPKILLRLAGEGETLGECIAYVKQHDVGNIEFLGLISQKEMKNFFNSLNLYVHCSYFETMSTSILQALACGRFLLLSNISGNSAFKNKPDLDIKWFENGSFTSFEKQVFDFIKNRESSKSESNVSYVIKNFSNQIMAKRYKELILKLVK